MALAVAVAACVAPGDEPSTAVVSGQTYWVGVGGGLDIGERQLTLFGMVQGANDESAFADDEALAVEGISPEKFLVARTHADRRRQDPQFGEFLVLWGDLDEAVPEVCPLFVSAPPTWC